LVLSAVRLTYDSEYILTFHSPGIEPWITGLPKNFKPSSVLDVGCGLDFWGVVLKNYLGISKVVASTLMSVRLNSPENLVYMMRFALQM
jgi:hypothetical protein